MLQNPLMGLLRLGGRVQCAFTDLGQWLAMDRLGQAYDINNESVEPDNITWIRKF